MKETEKHSGKKLSLNKQTISRLTEDELKNIIAGYKGCWENLWSLYYCEIIWTGDVPDKDDGGNNTN